MPLNLRLIHALTLIFLVVGCRSHASALRDRCSNAEKKGIDFLAASQQDGGAFEALAKYFRQ